MARLFAGEREINFINDLTKELIKDVIGQKIYYFSINEVKTKIHDVYEESPEKIYETPLEIDALVKFNPQEVTTNKFGSEEYYTIEVYLHYRDLLDKGIKVLEGDFFSYGDTFFEVIKAPKSDTLLGQIEHKSYITITGKQSRKDQFREKLFGPTSEDFSDSDAVQNTFVQQRGFEYNRLGKTGDVREMYRRGIVEPPIAGPAEVSPKGDDANAGSAFYGDDT